ncbi:type VI secretion system baseplate subunit TssG [Amorphus orientalis]|uniref:Type VI secretion system protein ImpH n=1 Tax=Amorphus orientalis TaxID=649198 RepID=A0AAE4AST0_9HYPH|nr:type VI secretion system baseplate subunit TssG [Amorphus orientalis]MDQ0314294.1 type VI secretion system protein ImpH [Amorphus orientalis]
MGPTDRRGESAIGDAELSALADYGFNNAVSRLQRLLDAESIGGVDLRPENERLRFRATRSLGFPAREVDSVSESPDIPGLIEIRVNFLGLYGPSSPLPPAYTERITRADLDDDVLEDFLDFFNHRMISLYRRIWARWRYHLRYRTGGGDPISARLLSLYGAPAVKGSRAADPQAALLLPQIGLLALYSRSSDVVASILTHHFKVPVKVREFVTREVQLTQEARGRLGASMQVGRNMIIGSYVRDSLGKFRVRVGPLSLPLFKRFLPSGGDYERLRRLIELTLKEPLEWDVELVLEDNQAAGSRLGRSQLGWTSWLGQVSGSVEPVVVAGDFRGQGPTETSSQGRQAA